MGHWKEGEPPKGDGHTYLLKFSSGIICTGSYRYGSLGDPQPTVLAWRCDCCGRFAVPRYWTDIN